MEDYYYIKISKFLLILWIILGVILCIPTMFLSFIIPIYYYLKLSHYKYYYNNERLIIEKGIINKQQQIVPLYRIVNMTATENIFNYGTIYIKDKQQLIVLKYVSKSKNEMNKMIKKWELAKKNNIRNEVI